MRLWLTRISVLALAVLLIAPPGWCCHIPAQAKAEHAAPKSCCQRHDEAPREAPAPRALCQCCQERGDTSVQARVLDAPSLTVAILAAPVIEPTNLSSWEGAQAAWLLPDGPPLQALLCVWRC